MSSDEIEPVRDATLARLHALLEDRDAGSLDEARALFRVWFRIHHYVRNKPSYTPHDTWTSISAYLNGTVSEEEGS